VGRRGRLELRRLRESRYDGMVVFIAGMVDGVGRFGRGVRGLELHSVRRG
jgi:hypothetical protein